MAENEQVAPVPVVPVIDEAAMKEKIKAELRKELADDAVTPEKNPNYMILGMQIDKKVCWAIGVAFALYGVHAGWWTWDNIKGAINSVPVASQSTSETVKVTETKSGPNPPAIPAAMATGPTPAIPIEILATPKIDALTERLNAVEAKTSATPDWVIQIQNFLNTDQGKQIFSIVIDRLIPKPQPAPTPDPNPAPNPNPNPQPLPNPNPAPQPVPDPSATLKLILTDEQGNPETAMTLDVNTITQVRIAGAQGKVIWNVVAVGNVGRPAFTVPGPDGKPVILGYSIELRNSSSWVQIHAVDVGSGQSVDAKITANQGAQPPPVPNVDPVNPIINPPQPAKPLSLVQLIYDASNQTPQVAILTQNQGWWANTYGSKWQFLTSGTQKQNGLKAMSMAQQQGVKPPFLAVWSNDSLVAVKAVPPNASLDSIPSIVNGALQ